MLLIPAVLCVFAYAPGDACSELDRTYEEVELMSLDGQDAESTVTELLAQAKRCAQLDTGGRRALEGYFLAFSVLQAGDELPPSGCEPLVEARRLATSLSAEFPSNARLQTIQSRLAVLADNIRCDEDKSEASPASADALSDEEGSVEPPPGEASLSDRPRLKNGAIASGAIAGTTLTVAVILTGFATAKAKALTQSIENHPPDGLGESSNICRLGSTATEAFGQCKELNNFKAGAIASWTGFGAAAISTVVFSVLYSRQKKHEQVSRLRPQFSIGRSQMMAGLAASF